MARKKKKDPLQYAANLTAVSALIYLGVTELLRLGMGFAVRLFNPNASLQNPIAVPEWVIGVFNLLLASAGLITAFLAVKNGLRGTPMEFHVSMRMPRDKRLWLFVPVFLGIGILCSITTSLLQHFLQEHTAYRVRASIRLPESSGAMLLYFAAICILPAILEELFVRGAIQAVFSRWGIWFSIVISSVFFALLHRDIAHMPALFLISVLMGLAFYCTGSPALGIGLHFAYNLMAFCLMYAEQKMDGISAAAFAVYMIALFAAGAIFCAALIYRMGVMRSFKKIPRVYDPKNRQSRLERLVTAPMYLIVMLALALRAVWPLFGRGS